MATVECRDIFNAVYTYVKGSYISSLFSSKTKDHTVSENINEDENLKKTKATDSTSETNVNLKETVNTLTENTTESIKRMDEAKVADQIRMDLDEKFPFALASVCSNLAMLDKEYRRYKSYDGQPSFSAYIIETSDDFPLCDRFVFPAIMYVSSMVLIDIDEKRSDEYYDKYATSVAQIIAEMPNNLEKTVEKYPY